MRPLFGAVGRVNTNSNKNRTTPLALARPNAYPLILYTNGFWLARYEANPPRTMPDFDIKAVCVLMGVN